MLKKILTKAVRRCVDEYSIPIAHQTRPAFRLQLTFGHAQVPLDQMRLRKRCACRSCPTSKKHGHVSIPTSTTNLDLVGSDAYYNPSTILTVPGEVGKMDVKETRR